MEATPGLEEFAKLAQEYCRWVEGPAGEPEEERQLALHLVARLYRAGLELLEVEAPENHGWVESRTHEEYLAARRRFACLPFQYYATVFDPHVVPAEDPVVGDVHDDLADIHGDLKEGLAYWEKGEPVTAAYAWRFNFVVHWGAHATGAMRALHAFPAGGA